MSEMNLGRMPSRISKDGEDVAQEQKGDANAIFNFWEEGHRS